MQERRSGKTGSKKCNQFVGESVPSRRLVGVLIETARVITAAIKGSGFPRKFHFTHENAQNFAIFSPALLMATILGSFSDMVL